MWARTAMRPMARLATRHSQAFCTVTPQASAKQAFPRETYQLVGQEAGFDQSPAPPRLHEETSAPSAEEASAPVHGVRHLESMLQQGKQQVDAGHFGRVLASSLAQNDYVQAEAAYALVEQHLTSGPDVAILTAALQIYARNGNPLPGLKVLELMRTQDLRPDAASLGAFLGALWEAQAYEKVDEVVRTIPSMGLDLSQQPVLQMLLVGLGRGEDRRSLSSALLQLAQHPDQAPPSCAPPKQEKTTPKEESKEENKEAQQKA